MGSMPPPSPTTNDPRWRPLVGKDKARDPAGNDSVEVKHQPRVVRLNVERVKEHVKFHLVGIRVRVVWDNAEKRAVPRLACSAASHGLRFPCRVLALVLLLLLLLFRCLSWRILVGPAQLIVPDCVGHYCRCARCGRAALPLVCEHLGPNHKADIRIARPNLRMRETRVAGAARAASDSRQSALRHLLPHRRLVHPRPHPRLRTRRPCGERPR